MDTEDDGLIIPRPIDAEANSLIHLSLVGRFLTERTIRTMIMKDRMASIWRPVKGVSISEIQTNIFLFQFFHILDFNRIYEGGPWSFDNNMLILSKIHRGEIPTEVPLFHIPVWVQVHNLPAGFMSQEVGKLLGNAIGEYLAYDEKHNTSFWKAYMRIRVNLDIRKPILKEKKIKNPGEEWKTVNFKYERLGQFCYFCGFLGHNDSFCRKLFDSQVDDETRNWDASLRATLRQQGNYGGAKWLRYEINKDDKIITHLDAPHNGPEVDHHQDAKTESNSVLDKKRRRDQEGIPKQLKENPTHSIVDEENDSQRFHFLSAVPGTQGCQGL
uniref:Uncharacterized protein At4g02000 family n=2 Tax=Cajanus cajan TaxID=3821 RepID=A0A151TBL4_CAJCA|nr:Uncharacterized protein At4g02000 family [Cajanus cajan]